MWDLCGLLKQAIGGNETESVITTFSNVLAMITELSTYYRRWALCASDYQIGIKTMQMIQYKNTIFRDSTFT